MGSTTRAVSEPTTDRKAKVIYSEVGDPEDATGVVFAVEDVLEHEEFRRQIEAMLDTSQSLECEANTWCETPQQAGRDGPRRGSPYRPRQFNDIQRDFSSFSVSFDRSSLAEA